MIIFCWTHPRTRSTAFEKCFSNIVKTMHEPFSGSYYAWKNNEETICETHEVSFLKVIEQIKRMEKEHGIIFIKELAYCVIRQKDHFNEHFDFFSSCKHMILTRDPKETIPSLVHQMRKVYGKDCPLEKIKDAVGIEDLEKLVHILRVQGLQVPIFQSEWLISDKVDSHLKEICEKLGLSFDKKMLHWQEGSLEDWKIWEDSGWHDDVKQSKGFKRTNKKYDMDLDTQKLIDECKKH